MRIQNTGLYPVDILMFNIKAFAGDLYLQQQLCWVISFEYTVHLIQKQLLGMDICSSFAGLYPVDIHTFNTKAAAGDGYQQQL